MIKVIGTLGTPIHAETDLDKRAERTQVFRKYKSQIIGDLILLNDTTIEVNFIDLESAQAFVTEMQAVYAKYNDTLNIEYA